MNKTQSSSLGRKLDPTRDSDLLNAALEVLSEMGYERMTMDMIAKKAKAGKGAMYRRWNSKAELVIEAVTFMKNQQVNLENLPDTGTLRGDLLALFKPQSLTEHEKKFKIMAGLISMAAANQDFATAIESAISKPWVEVQKFLIQRAINRKEFSKKIDLNFVSQILPAQIIYMTLISSKQLDKKTLTKLIDQFLLPVLASYEAKL